MSNLNFLASSLVGSRSFNLCENNSDTDIFIIGKAGTPMEIRKQMREKYPTEDLHCKSALGFLLSLFRTQSFGIMFGSFTGTPQEEVVPILTFLGQELENYTISNKKPIFSEYFRICTSRFNEHCYEISPKGTVTWMRYLETLKQYEKTGSWKKAWWIEDPIRTELLNIKHKRLSFKEVEEKFNNAKKQVEELKDFYSDPVDKEYNEWFFHHVCEILEVPYEQFLQEVHKIPEKNRIEFL